VRMPANAAATYCSPKGIRNKMIDKYRRNTKSLVGGHVRCLEPQVGCESSLTLWLAQSLARWLVSARGTDLQGEACA